MEKFIPYEKLSKKKKRELDRKARGTWGGAEPRHANARALQGLQQTKSPEMGPLRSRFRGFLSFLPCGCVI